MIKIIHFYVLSMILVFITIGCATKGIIPKEDKSDLQERVEFSLPIPEGWKLTEWPGYKYEVLLGPNNENSASNIIFSDGSFKGSLEMYVDYYVEQLFLLHDDNFSLARQSDFETQNKQKGIKLICHKLVHGIQYYQEIYFFDLIQERQFFITCTTIKEIKDYDKEIFDRIIGKLILKW